MRTTRTTTRTMAMVLTLAALITGGTAPAGAQGQRQEIGSVTARAPRSSVTLGQSQTSIELSGGVSVQTDTGDILRAQRIVLLVGSMPDPARPGQTKTDVRTATAVGDVSFKQVSSVRSGSGSFQRVITGTAERGELDRVTDKMALLRGVTVRSEDPIATYSLQNVASAAMNLRTNLITADAPASQQMKMTARQRVTQEKGPTYWRVINGSARHAELNRAGNTALLTGNVAISADEPTATYSWKNAARATVNFETQKVEAEAADGQQVNVDVRFKTSPKPPAPKANP